jgi:uncharacterized protein (DUF433 family)
MSMRITLELNDDQVQRLDRAARRLNQSRTEAAAQLLEAAVREYEFPHIELKDHGAGLEAFIAGTRLRVWRLAFLARDLDGDAGRIAELLNVSESQVRSALDYAAAFPEEIEAAIKQYDRDWEALPRKLAKLQAVKVTLTTADAPAT